MNLLYTITAYPPSVGGAQVHFHQLARRLVQRHGLHVVAHWAESRTDWLLGTTLLPGRRPAISPLDGVPVDLLSLTTSERLRILPFVLGYYAVKGPAIGRISDLLRRHLERLAPNPDLIHNSRVGREPLSYASLKLARQLGVPFVLTPNHHPRWVGWNYRHYIRLYQQADAVIALTEVGRGELIRLGVEPERVFVTGVGPVLGALPDASSFRQRYGVDGPMILFVGQKYRYKGCEALLQAAPTVWSSVPDACFVFIGPRTRHSRALFGHVSRSAELSQPRRILELGTVDLATKTNALDACDLLCLPSTQESFGGVFVEAWMLGKPVIGGSAPAVRDVIEHGVDGFVVEQDAHAIAERILFLLDHPAAREEMGRQGREKALARYTWERLARKTEQVYQAVRGFGQYEG
jgi:glycosyltransferase involved in cell wall biosynthesis